MIRKFQKGSTFEPNQFSINTKLKGLDRLQPQLPINITKPEINLAGSINTPVQMAGAVNNQTQPRMAGSVSNPINPNKKSNQLDLSDLDRVKGDGIRPLEALQLGLPLALSFLNKSKGATFKRTSNVINPATGLPYETINQVEQNINRGLRGLSRNKTTDALTNMINMNMGQANANQQLNDLYTKNAEQYLGDKRRMIGEINQEQREANDFYNKNEAMRAETDRLNKATQNQMITDTVTGLANIDAQNRQEKELKKQELFNLKTKQAEYQHQGEQNRLAQDSINKANARTNAQNELLKSQQTLQSLLTSGKTKDSPEYKQAEQDNQLKESYFNTANNEYNEAVKAHSSYSSNVNNSILQAGVNRILGKKYSKGGLTLNERKDLKQQEYDLKTKLMKAKEEAIDARDRLKEIRNKEAEFRKELLALKREHNKSASKLYDTYKK